MQMSTTETLPVLARPEYLHQVVKASLLTDSKIYALPLGLSRHLRRISPSPKLSIDLSKQRPGSFPDPPLVCSEIWSEDNVIKAISKNSSQTQCQSFMASPKCRFTTLGILLGWLCSLGVVVPILVLWLTAMNNTQASASSTSSTDFSLTAMTDIPSCTSSYCQETVIFTSNVTLASLLLTVDVQRLNGETYAAEFDTYSAITSTHRNDTLQLVYSFFLTNETLPAGSYTCGVEFYIPGVNHTTSTDTYIITATSTCGTNKTISGTF